MKNSFIFLASALLLPSLSFASVGADQFKSVCQAQGLHQTSARSHSLRLTNCKIIDIGFNEIGKLNEDLLVNIAVEIKETALPPVQSLIQKAIKTKENVEVTFTKYFYTHAYTGKTKAFTLHSLSFAGKEISVNGIMTGFNAPCAGNFTQETPFSC